MNDKKGFEGIIYKVLLGIFSITLVSICLLMLRQNNILDFEQEGLLNIEYIHSESQRISKLELEYSSDDSLIDILDDLTNEFVENDSTRKYFSEDQDMIAVSNGIVKNWNEFKNAVFEFRKDEDRDKFFIASEINYSNSEDTIIKIRKYVSDIEKKIKYLEIGAILNVLVIGLVFLRVLFRTHNELQENKELSKDMYIDSATGVYNSVKCHELLKTPVDLYNLREVAILIFDLNDLKKTNDMHGHQAGDELISTFAQQLKSSTSILNREDEIFIGRYGGDEFVAYITKTDNKEIQSYIDEVNASMKYFNDTEDKVFKISCAVGVSLTTPEIDKVTMKELFDVADADMYENKIEMKKQKKLDEEQANQ